jgi:hypothetical protein
MLKCCFQELNSPAVVKQNGRTSNGGSHILKEQKPSRTQQVQKDMQSYHDDSDVVSTEKTFLL